MDRTKWEYRKLGEVCDIEYGKRVVQQRDGGNIYPVYGGGGATFRMDTYNRENRVVISRFAMSPQCTRKVTGKFFLNDSGLTIKSNSATLLQTYLDTCILSLNDKIYLLGRGVAQKNLKVDELLKINIPIPSHSQQQTIVAELDKLNDMIALKRKQLTDLDSFAQSLFYEMFGDPVVNEKGWEVRKLHEICIKISDGPFGSNLKSEHYVDSGIRVIRLQNIGIREYIDKDKTYISEEHYKSLKKYTCCPNDVIIGTLGDPNLRACKIPQHISISIHKADCVHIIPDNSIALADYFVGLLNTPSFVRAKNKDVHGQTRGRISYGQIKQFIIPLPPLPLQQSFAAKIVKIEAEKQRVKSSLKDLETLLASRMQYWFDN